MNRRKFIQLTGLSLSYTVTGCLGTDQPRNTDTSPSDNREADPPRDTDSTPSDNKEDDLSQNAAAAQTPDPDHAIEIETATADPIEATVTVRRVATEETVHNQTYTVQPNETITAYNTRQAGPDGIEEFNLSVAAGESTESLTLETHQCWGDVLARVSESDGVEMVYSVC